MRDHQLLSHHQHGCFTSQCLVHMAKPEASSKEFSLFFVDHQGHSRPTWKQKLEPCDQHQLYSQSVAGLEDDKAYLRHINL